MNLFLAGTIFTAVWAVDRRSEGQPGTRRGCPYPEEREVCGCVNTVAWTACDLKPGFLFPLILADA